MPTNNETNVRIGNGSWISVALLLTCLMGVGGGAFWAASLKSSVDATALAITVQSKDVASIRDSMVDLQLSVRDLQRDILDRWRYSDEVDAWQQVQRDNPGFKIPNLRASSERRDSK